MATHSLLHCNLLISHIFTILFLLISKPLNVSASTADGEALVIAMKEWGVNFSSWIVGSDPCQATWQGVGCDANGRVNSLRLPQSGLRGPIPTSIGNLQSLTVLDLGNQRNATTPFNQISGDLSALESLANLQVLNVTLSNLQGPFPSAVLKLTNLIDLRIDNNHLNGTLRKEIAELTKLQYLYIANNSALKGPLPPEFGTLVNLKELSLWGLDLKCKIPPEIGNLQNLIYLNLHDCNLYGGLPPELGNLRSIQRMLLYSNTLTGIIPESWSNMSNIKNLILHKNSLSKYFPNWVLNHPTLYNMSMDNNYLYGPVPSNFSSTRARIVTFECNYFSGDQPIYNANFQVNFSGNCFTNYNHELKVKCEDKTYYDCTGFTNAVPNGSCPMCPYSQVLEDSNTCTCTLGSNVAGGNVAKKIGIIVGVVGPVVVLFMGLLIWIAIRKRRRNMIDIWEGPEGVVRYDLQEIVRATENFNNRHQIGVGGFGTVFAAELQGQTVAIKHAHSSSIQSTSGFRNEVVLLSRLHHKNLVHLLGFSEAEGVQILVYEFMPKGNLETMLFRSQVNIGWLRRLDIAIDIARGLEYLHSFANPPVIHRDVKPSNVLLDENMVAKLADFGVSKVAPEIETHFATRPTGTAGYIDPQYVLSEKLTTASDVYGFGIVLLEIVSGQRAIDKSRAEASNIVEWAKLRMNYGPDALVDPRLGDRYPRRAYEDIVRLAMDCVSFQSEERPTMKEVVTVLDACRWSATRSKEFSEEYSSENGESSHVVKMTNGGQSDVSHTIYNTEESNTCSVFNVAPR